ncbi:GNAT family N-acetyltransferase [Parabacteroides sp. OttesenSCG-928-G07]|nr:GNAT family N-acetyltransferase [Parabacteroides sp. OttesenSCG-928-G07]
MIIRKAGIKDLNLLMEVYAHARQFMQETGNKNQWINGYPSEEVICNDILSENSYVVLDEKTNELVAVFYFRQGDDPTYAKIYDGEWLNDKPYGVVHRMASAGKMKGIADYCLEWCYGQCANIRVDTHKDNLIMQNILKRNGYRQCGIIYVANGTERIAFQKTE